MVMNGQELNTGEALQAASILPLKGRYEQAEFLTLEMV